MKQKMNIAPMSRTALWLSYLLLIGFSAAQAQTSAFTYQGRFTDTTVSQPTNGTYNMQFALFDAATDGNQVGATLTNATVQVTNGIFTVSLDFGASSFAGAARFLEVRVFSTTTSAYVVLTPRQPITSTPYAIRSLTTATADNALAVGGTVAANIIKEGDARLSDSRTPIAGSTNYIQNQNAAAQPSANFHIEGIGTANIFNVQTGFNFGGQRFLSGAGTNNIFAGRGAGSANTTGADNSFFGFNAGLNNSTGGSNSFFGRNSGGLTTSGSYNTFIGNDAGLGNDNSNYNTAVGYSAAFSATGLTHATVIGADAIASDSNSVVLGRSADTVRVPGKLKVIGEISSATIDAPGTDNIFVGNQSGGLNTTGTKNSYLGATSGLGNMTGSYNSAVGFNAAFLANNLNYATAIGAYATVSTSNTIVLGRSNGSDAVQIPGNLSVAGTFTGNINGASFTNLNASNITSGTLDSARLGIVPIANGGTGSTTQNFVDLTTAQTIAGNKTFSNTLTGNSINATTLSGNIVNTATQYNIGGDRVFGVSGTQFNTFLGLRTGLLITSGTQDVFVGETAGLSNTTGSRNSFVGVEAGHFNDTGTNNSFFGYRAGYNNSLGSYNTLIGAEAEVTTGDLTYATAIGAGAIVSANSTIVLGRAADAVQIPGNLSVAGTITGNINGASLTNLNASNITSGTLADARLSSNVATLSGTQTFTGAKTFSGGINGNGSGLTNLTAANLTGIVPIANGGTGSATQNFVDLTTTQTVGGAKTFTGGISGSGSGLTNLNASNITSGTLANARLGIIPIANGGTGSATQNFVDLTTAQTIAGNKTFSATISGDVINATTISGNVINSATQYNIGGARVFSISGAGNTFVGFSGTANTAGQFNAFLGSRAGNSNVTGSNNSFFGADAGFLTTGGDNAFFGTQAGKTNTTGSFNTIIGRDADVSTGNLSFATAIGAGSVVSTSNTIVLGRNAGLDAVVIYGLGIGGSTQLCRNASNVISACSSSLRYKTNIAPFNSGLNVVNRLQPITFDWKTGGLRDLGLGAEDVAAIEPLLVTYNKDGQVEGVKYDRIGVVLVNAVKEQQAQIVRQQQQLDALKKIVCLDHPGAEVCK